MSNITKNHKVGLFLMFIAAALITSVTTFGDTTILAFKKSNGGEQDVLQENLISEYSDCILQTYPLWDYMINVTGNFIQNLDL
jgi:hypothetical protein